MDKTKLKCLKELRAKKLSGSLTDEESDAVIELEGEWKEAGEPELEEETESNETEKSMKLAIQSAFEEVKQSFVNINTLPAKEYTPGKALGLFLKAVKHGKKSVQKFYEENKNKLGEFTKAAIPMTEGTDADGGYLVPPVTQARILELIPTFGQGRQYMTQLPMGKAIVVKIPKEATLPTVTWTDEGVAKTDSKPTLGIITLTAKKAAGIVTLSEELIEDAIADIGDYVLRKFAQAFGTEEDKQFFNGTGSPFTGVFASSHTFGNTVTLAGQIGSLTYDDMLDAAYGIDSAHLNGAAWYMHRTVFAQVRKIQDPQGHYIFVPSAAAGEPSTILGYPFRLVENAPTSSAAAASTVILLGNLQNSIIGTKNDMRVKILTEATIDGTNLAENDLTGIRVVERVAFDAGLTAAYSTIKFAA